jgi:hypothetical protein
MKIIDFLPHNDFLINVNDMNNNNKQKSFSFRLSFIEDQWMMHTVQNTQEELGWLFPTCLPVSLPLHRS